MMYCFFNAADCLRNRRHTGVFLDWRRHMDADAVASSNQRCMWGSMDAPGQTCGRNMLILR